MDQRWYVGQLKAGRETRVAIDGLKEQGFETYYPQMQVVSTRFGRRVDGYEPVFPSYLFVRSAPDAARWRAVRGTRGMIRLLGNDQPCAMPDRVVDDLRHREQAGLLRHPYRRPICQGDTVEVRIGTLVGLQGVCQWTRRERIGVLLTLLGAATVTTVPRDWLKLAAV